MASHFASATASTVRKDEDAAAASSHPESEKAEDRKERQEQNPVSFKHFYSLWCIFSILCLLSLLTALDGTIITTSFPTIIRAIGGGSDGLYVWIAQYVIFSSTAQQPLNGQIANIFGRQNTFLVAITLFALGSDVAGGAISPAMLISGRTVQGIGVAGLYVSLDILVCRPSASTPSWTYLGTVLSTVGIGLTIGPVIGSIVAEHNWRWIFYPKIPVSVFGFLIIVALFKVNYTRSLAWSRARARVDLLGISISTPSTISIFYDLITGGVQEPWSSWRIVLPLLLGTLG